jgi:hypothetical protein
MGLAERQKALAQLYTDTRLRERFLADPLTVCRELGFSEEEASRIASIPPARVASFARSLHNKRLAEVGKILPLTSRVLGKLFNENFESYAEKHLPGGTKKHLGDALAFATHLQKVLREKGGQPRWVLDLLAYEKARIMAADPRCRLVVRYFRHDLRLLVRSLARKEEAAIDVRRCVAIWARLKRGQAVRYAFFIAPRLRRGK